jgi:hypothetical protein
MTGLICVCVHTHTHTHTHTQVCPTSDDWTEEEIRDLIEALIFVGEEWDVVAQIVKTKTMEQCVLQFARLPIADRYLQDFSPW